MTIAVLPLESDFRFHCPNCKMTLATVTPSNVDITFPIASAADESRQPWLSDGDAIPGLIDALSADRQGGDGWCAYLNAGKCAVCLQRYFTVEVELTPGDWNTYVDYTSGAIEPDGPERYSIAQAVAEIPRLPGFAGDVRTEEGTVFVAEPWLVAEIPTPIGVVHIHTFGPFELKQWSAVAGAHGVSACQGRGGEGPWVFARDLVLSFWDDIRANYGSALEATP